jgi:hypothetical protein
MVEGGGVEDAVVDVECRACASALSFTMQVAPAKEYPRCTGANTARLERERSQLNLSHTRDTLRNLVLCESTSQTSKLWGLV